jgi:hypothetical protein
MTNTVQARAVAATAKSAVNTTVTFRVCRVHWFICVSPDHPVPAGFIQPIQQTKE